MTAEMAAEFESGRRMRGLDRAVEILDYLRRSGRPARPNEIAVGIKAPKSTTYELINLLIKAGIVEYADKRVEKRIAKFCRMGVVKKVK